MSLRKGGIYSLPNGRELVVLRKHENGRRAYTLGGWGRFETTQYEVNDSGRLICHGKLTAWDVTNLRDTGRTATDLSFPSDRPGSVGEARL
jgi:hypothetical protein